MLKFYGEIFFQWRFWFQAGIAYKGYFRPKMGAKNKSLFKIANQWIDMKLYTGWWCNFLKFRCQAVNLIASPTSSAPPSLSVRLPV